MHGAPYSFYDPSREKVRMPLSIQYIFWGGAEEEEEETKADFFVPFIATMPLQNQPSSSLHVFEPVYSMTSAGTTPRQNGHKREASHLKIPTKTQAIPTLKRTANIDLEMRRAGISSFF